MNQLFLPVSTREMKTMGWEQPDFILVTADAYVDHPSFGAAIIGRWLQHHGFRVALLPQPGWKDTRDFTRLGKPRLGFLVSGGNMDSMVAHYTAAKKPRSEDAYSPGGQRGFRPDRPTLVYTNRLREAFGDIPIIIGGLEASLRRFAHYDYWENKVRHSVLADSQADLLAYGMGERAILAIAQALAAGTPIGAVTGVPGTCYWAKEPPEDCLVLPGFGEVSQNKQAYCKAFLTQQNEQDTVRGKRLAQEHPRGFLVQNPPAAPLTRQELDKLYSLPFARAWHPAYDQAGGIPALEEVRFSITATRGCFGGCAFCSLAFHQGRTVQSRSTKSILEEAAALTLLPGFKGYIHDIGGPTANFREPACAKQAKEGTCAHRQCLFPKPCPQLRVTHKEFLDTLRKARALPGVKKVFVRSGIRFDYLMLDEDPALLREFCAHHISGQLKVAPEHRSPETLRLMEKPAPEVYDGFCRRFAETNRTLGKEQYMVPYFISSHPGCTLSDAVRLAEYLRDIGHHPEQVQDFYPTPGTLATTMYYTGLNPRTLKPVFVPRSLQDKAMQRALLQYRDPKNHSRVRQALAACGREDLIGHGKRCLVPPPRGRKG